MSQSFNILVDINLLREISDFLYLEPGWGCGKDRSGRSIRRLEVQIAKEQKEKLYAALGQAIERGLEIREDNRIAAGNAKMLFEAQEMARELGENDEPS